MLLRLFLMIIFSLTMFAGCGGGSAGTGLGSSSIEGRILQQGQPVEGATVTVLETGDSAITDANGSFEIPVSESLENYTLEIQYQNSTQQVPVSSSSSDSIINVEIDVDDIENNPPPPLEVKEIQLAGKIVGICDQYFENKKVIRQSNSAPQGVECTAKVNITSESKAVGGVRFAVQHRNCDAKSKWNTDAVSETSVKYSPGTGQLQFKFFDDQTHCHYRIIAPFETEGIKTQSILIETFTAQTNK